MSERDFAFEFQDHYRPLTLMFGATSRNSKVRLSAAGRLSARFGFVRLETHVNNISGIERSGDYQWWKAIGVRASLSDRGLTFGSSTRQGVCLKFVEPVKPTPSIPGWRHPGLTLTLADPDGFIAALRAAGVPAPD